MVCSEYEHRCHTSDPIRSRETGVAKREIFEADMSDVQTSLIGLTAPEAPIDPLVDLKFTSNLQLAHSISEASSSIVSLYIY